MIPQANLLGAREVAVAVDPRPTNERGLGGVLAYINPGTNGTTSSTKQLHLPQRQLLQLRQPCNFFLERSELPLLLM